ncbi:MAG: DUF5050 domain-containing protein [Clostridiales bacterium]|nr:DUF5050 domain-containing protein [Clostridiales bacterium]
MQKKSYLGLAALALGLLWCVPAQAADEKENVETGSAVLIYEEDTLYFVKGENLYSASLDESGAPCDPVLEGSFDAQAEQIGIWDGCLYVQLETGIFRMQMEDGLNFQEVQQLTEDTASASFQIYGDALYYRYGYRICRVPLEGGEAEEFLTSVYDFALTGDGICYMDTDGGLYLASLDGKNREFLEDSTEENQLEMSGSDLFFWQEEGDCVYQYSLSDGALQELKMEDKLSKYYFYVLEDYFLFDTSDYEEFLYDRNTGETLSAAITEIPFTYMGAGKGNSLYYVCEQEDDLLYWYDAESDSEETCSLAEASDGSSGGGEASPGDSEDDTSEDPE